MRIDPRIFRGAAGGLSRSDRPELALADIGAADTDSRSLHVYAYPYMRLSRTSAPPLLSGGSLAPSSALELGMATRFAASHF